MVVAQSIKITAFFHPVQTENANKRKKRQMEEFTQHAINILTVGTGKKQIPSWELAELHYFLNNRAWCKM